MLYFDCLYTNKYNNSWRVNTVNIFFGVVSHGRQVARKKSSEKYPPLIFFIFISSLVCPFFLSHTVIHIDYLIVR